MLTRACVPRCRPPPLEQAPGLEPPELVPELVPELGPERWGGAGAGGQNRRSNRRPHAARRNRLCVPVLRVRHRVPRLPTVRRLDDRVDDGRVSDAVL